MNVGRHQLLRSRYDGVIFDLDGVITNTARLHARAWKQIFDQWLATNDPDKGFVPFDLNLDYLGYVDGKPRYQGVKSFLQSRDLALPFGNPEDPPEAETICGLGNRKQEVFLELVKSEGVTVYKSSLDLLFQLRSRGYRLAVASSSKNCTTLLNAANIRQLFDVQVDGVDAEHLDLKGKPEPDVFWEALRLLEMPVKRCVVVEDALSGVQAGKNGNFNLVVGVDREGAAAELKKAGADLVVQDLAELDLEGDILDLPQALDSFPEIQRGFEDKRVAIFLDYDGTLTPIVSRPEEALLSQKMRQSLVKLAEKSTVAIVSGRGLADVRALVDIDDLYYAGSHGFEIEGPFGLSRDNQEAEGFLPVLDDAEQRLQDRLAQIQGAQVERKRFSIAVHFRNVAADKAWEVEQIVDAVLADAGELRKGHGKKVYELKPDLDWDKGKALHWLMENLELIQPGIIPVFIGDDLTDEDAFKVLDKVGLSVVVGAESRKTAAKYRLQSVDEVREFLDKLNHYLEDWSGWSLVYDQYLPAEEGVREALCTLGNGYFATRGAVPTGGADDIHYPGTYLAGGYNRLNTEINGRIIVNEDLVNMPNWLCLDFRFEGEEWFSLDEVEILSFRQELNLKNGILFKKCRVRDKKGRETKLYHRRFVHMANMHLAGLELVILPVNWSGQLEIRSALDGGVTNTGVKRYQSLSSKHLEPVRSGLVDDQTIELQVRTNQSKLSVALAARTEIFKKYRQPVQVSRRLVQKPEYIAQEFSLQLEQGTGVALEKIVSLYTSKDPGISEQGLEARDTVRMAQRFTGLLEQHNLTWKHLWQRFSHDIELRATGSDHFVLRALRLYSFHLLQTASLHSLDIDVGMPARGWHGEGYRGHIFWDELIIFPFLNYRTPHITRSLLMYRYRRLQQARRAARALGYKGAMYPWQSGSNGREETQQVHLNPKSGRWLPDNSHLQRHINAAIVYNIWQYCQVTGEKEFLSFYGAEMILEIARFFASITTYNKNLDRFEINGVMGPDEYHDGYPDKERPGLKNNAYTNVMVVFIMNRALELPSQLSSAHWQQLCERLGISRAEISRWQAISQKMRVVFHGQGIISQFEGYDQLQEFDWEGYREKYGNIQRLDRILEAENDTANRYKVSKQADVLMLFYFFSSKQLVELFQQLGYTFKPEHIPANIDYYLQRTSNGSSLSSIVHSWVSARRDRKRSWELFQEALKTDICDIQGGTTSEGIHLGAMAGCVDIIQRGYTGLDSSGDTLHFNPLFPEEVKRIKLHLRYRGHWLEIDMVPERVRIHALSSGFAPVKAQIKDQVFELEQGRTCEAVL